MTKWSGTAGLLVSAKEPGVLTPVAVAVIVEVPAAVVAVRVGAVAVPVLSVVTCTVLTPPVKVALGPVVGAVKVMVYGVCSGLPYLSVNCTVSGVAKAVLTTVVCDVPVMTVIVAGTSGTLV